MLDKLMKKPGAKKNILAAKTLMEKRLKDVNDLKAHIVYLQKTKKEAEKDRKTRIARIASNKALLKKFKEQRCDNNLIFVKQLREIMQGMEVMKLLRGDIVEYFNGKKKGHRGVAFLQSFEEFSHLLDDEHKNVFAQLKSEVSALREHKLDRDAETQKDKLAKTEDLNKDADELTKEDERTKKEIGKGHVDNKRGELKKLAVPAHQKIAAFNKDTRAKVLGMIDGMIKHLKVTRKHLTTLEIKAAEDFAIFQNSMEEENERLVAKIAELTKEIEKLTRDIAVSQGQLVKREKLLKQAQEKLRLLKKMCAEKMAYFKNETARRNKENRYINKAISIFNNAIKKLSERVRSRVNSKVGADGKFTVQDMGQRVVKSAKSVRGHVTEQNEVRNEVVL